MPHAPPVAKLALAYAAGVSWGLIGAPLWAAPLLVTVCLAAPITTSRRRKTPIWIAVAAVGAVAVPNGADSPSCRFTTGAGTTTVQGRFLAAPRAGSAPFATPCGVYTVVTSDSLLPAGEVLSVTGFWMEGRRRPWLRARGARVEPRPREGLVEHVRWSAVRWRDDLVERAHRLYGERASLVSALTLARREGMEPAAREVFARTGIAHLLAISGFHVGVIATVVLALLRSLRVARRRAGVVASGIVGLYVALIGFPAAACRAALIFSLVATSKLTGRPPARWGALATALLVLLVIEPAGLASPGFQLSFAGAAGLVMWARPVSSALERWSKRRCPRSLATSIGAGVAATLATLPVVAWHFERVSVVGIPVTLAATPLVTLALPGAIASLLIEPIVPGAATFLAGGVDLLLAVLEGGAGRISESRWASAWISPASVVAGMAGLGLALGLARHPRVRQTGRRALVVTYIALGVVAWPLVMTAEGWGTLGIVLIDVGQGDAIALRSPRGRWILVDAGPPLRPTRAGAAGEDAARFPDHREHPVVRTLATRGVVRLETLVLTHADLDHIGGAVGVIESFDVGAVRDPALPVGKAEYAEVLGVAADAGVPWLAARAGQSLDFDGATIDVLHPGDSMELDGETNEASVILRVRFGDFDALLTGDAYKGAERRVAAGAGDLEVLKLGHHGSDTSTDSLLLAATRPELAVVSVGRANRYGHPDPEVLDRLDAAGIPLLRTDLSGTISITARQDGSFSARTEKGGRWGEIGPARGR